MDKKMKKFIQLLIVVSVFVVNTCLALAADVPTISVEEIKPGMLGYAKTVVKGRQIETFDVEVLGVTGSEVGGYSIMIRAFGPLIERSGGIGRGMSGSPVYLDGRLAGAVAYGQAFNNPCYCFLTPIADMLKLLDEKVPRPKAFTPVSTALMASGFTESGTTYLKELLHKQGIEVMSVPSGTAPAETDLPPVEPGSAVGVCLAKGDLQVSAIGTITYVSNAGEVLAFGHSFLKKGEIDAFLTDAYILATVPNVQIPFKVGNIGRTIGHITQDRAAGISGKLGVWPKTIPMHVSATDKTRGKHVSANVQLVTNENMVPALASAISYSTGNKAYDQTGGGTARVKFRILAEDEEGKNVDLYRDNMFFSSSDISKNVYEELHYACDMLMRNKFGKVKITDINVDEEFTSDYEVAEITRAKMPSKGLKPGVTVPITVEFKPYRGKKFERTVEFKIPEEQKSGEMPLIIRSGNSFAWLIKLLKKQKEEGEDLPTFERRKKLSSFVRDFNAADANNDLVIDILPVSGKKLQKKLKNLRKSEGKSESQKEPKGLESLNALLRGSKYKQRFPQDFITDGEIELVAHIGEKHE